MNRVADALWLLWTSQGFDIPLPVCEGIARIAETGRGAYLSPRGEVCRYSMNRGVGTPLVVEGQPRPIEMTDYLQLKCWVSAVRVQVLRSTGRIPPVTAMVLDPATVEWMQRA